MRKVFLRIYLPWGVGDIKYLGFITYDVWMGTSSYMVAFTGDDVADDDDDYDNSRSSVVVFSTCTESWCEDCEAAGATSLTFTCFALILAVVGLVSNLLPTLVQFSLSDKHLTWVRMISLASTLLSSVFAITAFLVYLSCHHAFVDYVEGLGFSVTLGYGVAAYMVLSGCVVMMLAAIVNSAPFVIGYGNGKNEEGATDAEGRNVATVPVSLPTEEDQQLDMDQIYTTNNPNL